MRPADVSASPRRARLPSTRPVFLPFLSMVAACAIASVAVFGRPGEVGTIGGRLASSQCQLVGAMTVQILPVFASAAASAPSSPRLEALRASCDQYDTVRARSATRR